jgi:hypothetical protein
MFFEIRTSTQRWINVYVCNLQRFVISWSVCPHQALLAQLSVRGQGQEPTLEVII